MTDENNLINERKRKLNALKEKIRTYSNKIDKHDSSESIKLKCEDLDKDSLDKKEIKVNTCGRIMTVR